MKVVSWNVNSIHSRLDRVVAFLKKEKPDILCLQELKCLEEKFPFKEFEVLQYQAAVFGQKTYNGVAILSRHSIKHVQKGFGDPAARMIAVKTGGLHVIGVYVPNGQEVGSEKYQYKLDWFSGFEQFIARRFKPTDNLVIAGDYNVAPEDIDVHDPDLWRGRILFSEKEKAAFAKLCGWGLLDTFRELHPKEKQFSWWDYRGLCFPKNMGLRIDFVLATRRLMDLCQKAEIYRNERKGEKPSDHAPVMALFDFQKP